MAQMNHNMFEINYR